jgi:hypothetical protein
MATTTNYSWSTPDDTALVKDGAAAIRTLGSSIDTTTKALNPSTTLGDIEYRSSTANTNTRLGIGSNGQVLTISGGVPAWGTTSGGLSLITRTSFSNQATVNIDSVFSSTYRAYIVVVEGISAVTASDDLLLLPRISSTTVTTGYYGNRIEMLYNSSTVTGVAVNNQSNFILNTTTANTSGQMLFTKVGNGTENSIWQGSTLGSDSLTSCQFWANIVASGTVTGFQLKSSSTNITGVVAVYGMAVA